MVAVENFPATDDASAPDTGFDIVSAMSDDRTHYGFDLVVLPSPDRLRIRLSWDVAKYDADLMERIGAQLSHVIEQALERPEIRPSRMNILPADQWEAAVRVPNQTTAGYRRDATIAGLFDAQAERTPDAPALLAPHRSNRWVTYRELQARAGAVAAHLVHDLGIPAHSRIAVCLAPSESSIVSILGILKAGCTYVPVDPRYPFERIEFILQDSHARAVLTDGAPNIPAAAGVPIVNVEAVASSLTPRHVLNAGTPDDVAYVIYTSGSTGTPKGCEVTHRNVVRLMINDRHDFDFRPSDVWIMAHSLSFDFSVWEIYGALLTGGRLVVPSRDVVQDVPAFRDLLASCRVTVLNQTPLAFSNLIAVEDDAPVHSLGEHLRYVVFGGDRLDVASLRPWITHYPPETVALINMYGITETTVHVTFCRLTRAQIESPSRHSPIGRPIPETTVYVCDRHLNPQPIGAPGEMLVGGTGVCRGYLNRPELTAQRFLPDPFGGAGKLYRSGDLAIRDASGALSFIGRNDDQAKIRGHRIEPAEIERGAARAGRRRAGRDSRRDADRGRRNGIDRVRHRARNAAERRVRCARDSRDACPTTWCRAASIVCDVRHLPLTAHGKLDRNRVLQMTRTDTAVDAAFEPPATARERILAEIWAACLGVERVGRRDRFVNLGGDSIKSIQILAQLRARGLNLELKDLFTYPTIADLAPLLTERRAVAAVAGVRRAVRADADSTAVLREASGRSQPFQPRRAVAVALRTSDRPACAEASAAGAVRRARCAALAILSSRLDGTWSQAVSPRGTPVRLTVVDLSQETRTVGCYLSAFGRTSRPGCDLGAGPLFRAALYRGATARIACCWSRHHLVVDGVTWRILLDDLSAALDGGARPSPTDSFSAVVDDAPRSGSCIGASPASSRSGSGWTRRAIFRWRRASTRTRGRNSSNGTPLTRPTSLHPRGRRISNECRRARAGRDRARLRTLDGTAARCASRSKATAAAPCPDATSAGLPAGSRPSIRSSSISRIGRSASRSGSSRKTCAASRAGAPATVSCAISPPGTGRRRS